MEYPIVGDLPQRYKRFADYKSNAYNWITLATGEYYPDVLPYCLRALQACISAIWATLAKF